MRDIDSEALAASFDVWRPHLRALGTIYPYVEDVSPGKLSAPRILWIRCDQGLLSPLVTFEILEGLVALALLARVDVELWKSVLKEIWADRSSTYGDVGMWIDSEVTELMTSRQPEAFTLGLIVDARVPDDIQHLVATRVDLQSFSDHMQGVLQLMGVTVQPEDEALRVPVSCRLVRRANGNHDVARPLKKILSILTPSKKLTNVTSFQFEIVGIQQFETLPDMKALDLLLQIRALGVCIENLPPLRPYCGSPKNAALLVSVLQSLLVDDHRVPGFRSTGVHNAVLSDVSPLNVVEAVLSAITVSSVVRSVSIQFDRTPDELDHKALVLQGEMWELVARYLFSGYARHQVKNLDLDLHRFSEPEMNAVESVLETDNPLHDLGSHPRDNQLIMRISATRFTLKHKYYGEEIRRPKPDVTFESAEPIEVQVLRASSRSDEIKGWLVQLPGRGEAWVAETDVITSTVLEPSNRHVELSTFEEITVLTSDLYLDHSARLLARIGKGTKKLTVSHHLGGLFLDHWIDTVLGTCTAIEDVAISDAQVETLLPFVAHTASGANKLRRLALSEVIISGIESIVSFFQALCDPSHHLSLHLQDLSLGLDVLNEQLMDLVELVVQTLLENQTLRKIWLRFRLEDQELLSVAHDAFALVVGRDPWFRRGPMDLSSKLAFLSVLRGNGTGNAGVELDSNVIAIIFQLAAPAFHRQLRIEFT